MAEADWTYLNNGLDIAAVDRGVTAGVPSPPGGGNFVFGFNSLAAVQGAVGLFANLVSFAPMAKGGSIRGCLSAGPEVAPLASRPSCSSAARGTRSTTARTCWGSPTTTRTAWCCARER